MLTLAKFKWFDGGNGYGFATTRDGNDILFTYYNLSNPREILNAAPSTDLLVEYVVTPRGFRATSVSVAPDEGKH